VIQAHAAFHDTAVLDDGTVVGLGGEPSLRWWKDGASGAIPAHHSGGIGLRRSPDGAHFATFGFDGDILLWTASPLALVHRVHAGPLSNVVFLNDGLSLVSSGADGRVLLWTPASDAPRVVAQFSSPLATVEVLRSDQRLIVAERGGSIWRTSVEPAGPPQPIRTGHGESISHLAASDSGLWLAVGTSQGDVALYPTTTWQPISVLHAQGSIRVISFSVDMSMIAVVSEDGFAYLVPHPFAVAGATPWRKLALAARNVRFSPDHRFLAITTSNDGVFFYSLLGGAWHYFPSPAVDVFRGRFSRDGRRFATVDGGGRVTLFDLARLSG
jgi:WD40 repeat protein